MSQYAIEIILTRQLASQLAIPAFLVDPDGTLLYFNQPAESILGRRFEDAGPMPIDRWSRDFVPIDESGAPLPPEALPLVAALRERRAVHSRFWISGLDGGQRRIGVTAIPLIGAANRLTGALALFWEENGQ